MLSAAFFIVMLSVAFFYCNAECHYAEYHYVMVMLSVIMLSVVMLIVMAPFSHPPVQHYSSPGKDQHFFDSQTHRHLSNIDSA
jgi:hypothetical protein